jgi:catechol 2,3-dioxygenase-like lactoylglutathione lyase family enzyme
VANLDRSVKFYTDVVGLTLGRLEDERRIAFLFAGGWNHTMVGLWEKPEERIPPQHIAFEVARANLAKSIERLKRMGVQPMNFFEEATDVPTVLAWMPAVSIYFRDPDGHLLEFIAKLPGKPHPEKGLVAWNKWMQAPED